MTQETKGTVVALQINKDNKRVSTESDYQLYEGVNRVYSPANKPSAADVGALPIVGGTLTGVVKATEFHTTGRTSLRASYLYCMDKSASAASGMVFQSGEGDSPIVGLGSWWNGSTKTPTVPFAVGTGANWYEGDLLRLEPSGQLKTKNQGILYGVNNKPTAADVGALALSGGTVTGDTTFSKKIFINLSDGVAVKAGGEFEQLLGMNDGAGAGGAYIGKRNYWIRTGNATEQPSVIRGGTRYFLYHQGNKPTASDVGALPITGGALTGNLTVKTSALSTSITNTDDNAPIRMGTASTGADGGTYFLPLTAQSARHGQGYITHVTTGLVKNGYGSGWGDGVSGFFVGVGGSDTAATEYFTLAYGGKIKHSKGHEFYSTAYKPTAADVGAIPTTGGTFTGDLISSSRNGGVFGVYDSYKTDQIWSMGTNFRNASDGSNFGTLYGFGYKHTNNTTGGTMGGGHQGVWCVNGAPKAALGESGIWTAGSVTAAGNVTAYSDERIKTDINTIENALDKVLRLRGVTYKRTDTEDNKTHIGVIAQEIEKVLPEVVSIEDQNGYEDFRTVSYGNITALLIEAIKEQQKQIDLLMKYSR